MTNEMHELSRSECLDLLTENDVGRVAVSLRDEAPVIRPVNYAFDKASQSVVFRTAPGSKFYALLRRSTAAFEVDGLDPDTRTGWSVIIVGAVEEVTSLPDLRRLDAVGLEHWAPGEKPHWVRIRAWTVSGRRIGTASGRRPGAVSGRRIGAAPAGRRIPFEVLIAGGGVAALEGALALRELAGERIRTTLLAPDPSFVYRPARVREPFGYSAARTYPLDEIAHELGIELVQDSFESLDPPRSAVRTARGEELEYDALLLATGAQLGPAFSHGLTIDDARLDEQLHGLIEDVEGGYVSSIAFVSPSAMPWPLPIYELALMTARRAYDMGIQVAITIATPEDAPLAVFGQTVSDAVSRLLEDNGIATITSAHCSVPAPGRVMIRPAGRTLEVDRVVALPQLSGPSMPGVPRGSAGGFISIDQHCRVRRLENVFAAGDATEFPIKFGGIAAQQADTAAMAIAALAGAPVEPEPFDPVLRAILLGADVPFYLTAHVTGEHGSSSRISREPSWSPPAKIAAKYLAPFLEARDRDGERTLT